MDRNNSHKYYLKEKIRVVRDKVGVVIPAFNEEATIGNIVSQLRDLGVKNILVVDDGSVDATADIAEREGAKVIKHVRNLGQGASIRRGLRYFSDKNVEGVVLMDADGQHDPKEIIRFLDFSENKKITVGNRMQNSKNMPLLRWITNKVMSYIISFLCKQYIPDTQCGYRFIRKELLSKLYLISSKYELASEMLLETAKIGTKIYSVPITTIYNNEKSQVNNIKDTLRFLRLNFRFIFKSKKVRLF